MQQAFVDPAVTASGIQSENMKETPDDCSIVPGTHEAAPADGVGDVSEVKRKEAYGMIRHARRMTIRVLLLQAHPINVIYRKLTIPHSTRF